MGAQRSACLDRVNGHLNLGLIRTRSVPPNKHAHSRSVINSSPSADLFPRQLCTFFPVQRWTSKAWSSPRWRPTAWTASATARRRTITASKAAPATPATQPHIPTDCSHTTVRTPRGHPSPCQLPMPPFSQSRSPKRRPLPASWRHASGLFLLSWSPPPAPAPAPPGSKWGSNASSDH